MAQIQSTNIEQAKKVQAALEALGNATRGYESVSSGIRDHDQTWYAKPEKRTFAQGAELFAAAAAEEREEVLLHRTYDYRPYDGAHATAKALFKVYGHPGFGKAQYSMFGKIPPHRLSVKTSPNTTVEVPWGELEVPDLQATLILDSTQDEEKGSLFTLHVRCRKVQEKAVSGLFNLIEEVLREESLYRGKAITGAETPEFIDLSRIRANEVIFKANIQEALEHEVWFPVQNMPLMIADGQPTRWVSLFAGDYGTGKTLATMLTAQHCEKHGITFIQCRPAVDNLEEVMQTAMLYSPAVVAYEDVETAAGSNASQATISRMLEAFDGIRSKGADVQVILTSNRPEEIDPGIIRAGRVHTYLLFEGLDADALTQLIKIKVGEHRLDNLDGQQVFAACKDYSPSFMDLVIQVSRRYALSRNTKELEKAGTAPTRDLALNYRISTSDLVDAALRLHPQWVLMQEAKSRKGAIVNPVESAFTELVADAVTHVVKSQVHGLPLLDRTGSEQGLYMGKKVKNLEQQQS